MYLKRLELHGYKSFARKTEFVFGPGITAIVGPNGSGKSNIADAVRWALGETRMSRLRAKVTEDLIFAGSDGRARLGMAQVTMILDNSDGVLPIDYAEVAILRRAYRDGQNEYLLNGTKVRLRDIVELLGAGGLTRDAYVVIGQGLVDAALSLRPEERRVLIDVAAGLRPMQERRDRALARLDETQNNLTRVYDIIAELEPRLRRLERQAERARRGVELARELEAALQTWYAYRWHRDRQALKQARARVDVARQTLERQRSEVRELEAQIAGGRDREETQTQALARLRQQRAETRAAYEALRRELAVRRERATWLGRRQEELTQEIQALQARRGALTDELDRTRAREADLRKSHQRLARQVETRRAAVASRDRRVTDLRQALVQARQRAFKLAARLSSAREQMGELEQRRDRARQESAAQEKAAAELQVAIREQHQALEAARARAADLDLQIAALEAHTDETRSRLRAEMARQEALRQELVRARAELETLEARRRTLAETRAEATGGARAVLSACEQIGGVIGPLASLIHVPPEYETAIEAALGPLQQAIVVETQADAERAVNWLRAQRAGRATFIPLDVRASRSEVQCPTNFSVAADLVMCDARYWPVVERLLGSVIVVPDLSAALRFLGSTTSPGVRIVTRDGIVVESSGVITGGAGVPGRLAEERSWRELPERIAQARQRVAQLEDKVAECDTVCEALSARATELEAQWRDREQTRSAALATLTGAEREIEALEREAAWRAEMARQRADEVTALEAEAARLESQIEADETAHAEAEAQAGELYRQLRALNVDDLRREVADAEKQLALVEQERESLRRRQAELQAALTELETQAAARDRQRQDLGAELEQLTKQIAAGAADEAALAEELEALEAELRPVEQVVKELRQRDRQLEGEVARARERLRQAEAALSEALLEVQRREDRLRALQEKIADDVELAAVDPNLPRQLALQLDAQAAPLPVVTEVPEGLEQRIRELRSQVRRLGGASPEVLAEYQATKERHEFLTGQAADLEEAAADLRRLAEELNETMAGRFERTFKRVADAFSEYFTRLFDGGEARLQLTEPEDEQREAGLDIVARPPGKRSQSLAMLSGGERALTAVALLFALLRVSPTPFCVLDEVDATLDDANIGRFRTVLEELAQDTQVIIITHNRGTIQAADTIYGISMGEAGVSQVLSLRPDEVFPASQVVSAEV